MQFRQLHLSVFENPFREITKEQRLAESRRNLPVHLKLMRESQPDAVFLGGLLIVRLASW